LRFAEKVSSRRVKYMKFRSPIKIVIFSILIFMITSSIPVTTTAQDEPTDRQDDISNYEDTMLVKGMVFDGATEKPIAGAVLHFFNDKTKFSTETNEEGAFIIELPSGVFEVEVYARGYIVLHEKVAGRPDQVLEVKYPLRPSDSENPPPPPPDNGDQPPRDQPDDRPPEDGAPREGDIRLEEPRKDRSLINAMGGGDIVVIKNGDSEAFVAVIFGTREKPNHITILTSYTRYIGAGNLYDQNGALIGKNYPIAVKTIYMQTFNRLIEYEDANNDGMFNFAEIDGKFGTSIRHEPAYKAVPLKTAWKRSEIKEDSYDESTKEFSFSLTSQNLKYNVLGDPARISGRGNLDIVKFTFHVYMKKDQITREDVPFYSIDVEKSFSGDIEKVVDAEFEEFKSYEGSRISTKVKYDYLIAGWDYDKNNIEAPQLFMDMSILLLHAMDDRVAEWLNHRIIEDKMRHQERCQYTDADGNEKEFYLEMGEKEGDYQFREGEKEGTRSGMMEPMPPEEEMGHMNKEQMGEPEEGEKSLKDFDSPELIKDNQMRFADDMYKLGGFSWLNNVTADGKDIIIKFQIQKVGWAKRYIEGKYYSGMFIKGGFNLPAANRIYHDPTFSADAYELEISSESLQETSTVDGRLIISAGIMLVVITVILVSVYASIRKEKGQKMVPPKLANETPIPPPPRSVMDKDRYERKKPPADEYYESYYIDWDD
jgi:hypothetical protein